MPAAGRTQTDTKRTQRCKQGKTGTPRARRMDPKQERPRLVYACRPYLSAFGIELLAYALRLHQIPQTRRMAGAGEEAQAARWQWRQRKANRALCSPHIRHSEYVRCRPCSTVQSQCMLLVCQRGVGSSILDVVDRAVREASAAAVKTRPGHYMNSAVSAQERPSRVVCIYGPRV